MPRESQVVRIASCYWWVSCTPLAHRASRSRRVAWQLGADWRCFTGASDANELHRHITVDEDIEDPAIPAISL